MDQIYPNLVFLWNAKASACSLGHLYPLAPTNRWGRVKTLPGWAFSPWLPQKPVDRSQGHRSKKPGTGCVCLSHRHHGEPLKGSFQSQRPWLKTSNKSRQWKAIRPALWRRSFPSKQQLGNHCHILPQQNFVDRFATEYQYQIKGTEVNTQWI